jgi:hypothetical protein
MDLDTYLNELREGFAAATAAADEETRGTAILLNNAIEPAARLMLMNALSDLAAEVTAELGDRTVEVRLDGRDVRVAVSPGAADSTDDEEPAVADDAEGSDWGPGFGHGFFGKGGPGRGFGGGFGGFGPDGGDISRVTLRLVEQMKNQAERAAANQDMSLNSMVAQAVQGALHGHGPFDQHGKPGKRDRRSERRVKGWVQG